MPDFSFEDDMGGVVAGVDEAGRGPWAGPVIAGAVILDRATIPDELIAGLDDSKKLKAERRESLLAALRPHAHIGIGVASVQEIDEMNILQATMMAMLRAVTDLGARPGGVLIDGNRVPEGLPCPARAVVKGDGLSLSIAAASIVAKVTRDRRMADLDARYPGYGWASNAGYGTQAHRDALSRLGVTPEHRRSFAPIRKILGGR